MKVKKRYLYSFVFFLGIVSSITFYKTMEYTSTNSYCESCHVHPHVTKSWKLGKHYDNKSGVVVGCTQCHLPPSGIKYYSEKFSAGIKDVYSYFFKDISKIDWVEKSTREYAQKHVFKASCVHCHQNLFQRILSKEGEKAHLYYSQNKDMLRCINCHLHTGHYHKEPEKIEIAAEVTSKEVFTEAAIVDSFKNFAEKIPGTYIQFDMVAIPGGSYMIGSLEDEEYIRKDEHPQRNIKISPFWMGRIEVNWDEYLAFYKETAGEGRTEDQLGILKSHPEVDAITGPTPPYGNPDQGWGRGSRPAITMNFFGALTYCQWLSQKTGKKYRLPTEAEWEYACRGGQESPYFFNGEPSDYSEKSLLNRIFGADTTNINSYAIYKMNSHKKSGLPKDVKPNPFGLINMSGNVKEFCSDFYSENTYKSYPSSGEIKDPKGPTEGKEHVIRGGSFKSDAADIRSAAREATKSKAWLITDPQMPKSRWWYSDCNDVGFRIVCEYEGKKVKSKK